MRVGARSGGGPLPGPVRSGSRLNGIGTRSCRGPVAHRLVNEVGAAFTGDFERGKALWPRSCAHCHDRKEKPFTAKKARHFTEDLEEFHEMFADGTRHRATRPTCRTSPWSASAANNRPTSWHFCCAFRTSTSSQKSVWEFEDRSNVTVLGQKGPAAMFEPSPVRATRRPGCKARGGRILGHI
jgi:hypothetical protein